ncbi:MAG: tripartite tricarboxylate transporter substrate binding protein [Betaproteobacteria bacterium]|nr:tripartite tricarboxylate transporter substrate binding protein [Betaproteobacteria bacterium]
MSRRFPAATLAALLMAASAVGIALTANAQGSFPNRPIRIIVGLAAGGGTDVIARMIAPKLSESLGQPVIVENRVGGNNVIAAEAVIRAPADGHMLFMAPSGTMTINPVMYQKLGFSPRDFTPISLVSVFPLLLVVDAALPIRSMKDLAQYLNANPGKANYSATGPSFGLPIMLLKQRLEIGPMEFIQYKGSNEAVAAVMAGDVVLTVVDTGPALGAIRGGRVRALAVTSPARQPAFPEIPTMTELGFPELELQYWMGLFAKAGTPMELVKRLEAEIGRVVKLPDIRESMRNRLLEATSSTSEELTGMVYSEMEKWESVRKRANIKHID